MSDMRTHYSGFTATAFVCFSSVNVSEEEKMFQDGGDMHPSRPSLAVARI